MKINEKACVLAALVAAIGVFGSSNAQAQELSAHLTVTVDGEQLVGESLRAGREGTIECETVEFRAQRQTDETARVVSATTYSPITCKTSFGTSTVQLWKALAKGSDVDAAIDFFGANATAGMGPVFSIEIWRARVLSVSVISGTPGAPVEIQLAFSEIVMTDEATGESHADHTVKR